MEMNTINILGVKIDRRSEDEIVRVVDHSLDKDEQKKIYTPNPEFIVEGKKNPKFVEVLNNADINIPDGIGLLWASKFLTLPNRFEDIKKINVLYTYYQVLYSLFSLIISPSFCTQFIPARISGSDFFWTIVDMCNKKNKRIFLLGAAPGIAERVRDRLQKIYPKLQVAGTYAGSPDRSMDDDICHFINTGKPDVLFVAYGAPKQELWIDRNIEKLPSVKIAIGVGGTFDFVAGVAKRAPAIMRKFGLEWLFRLITMPSRVKRIYNATFKFVGIAVKEKIRRIEDKNTIRSKI